MIAFFILAVCLGGVASMPDESPEEYGETCYHHLPYDKLDEAEMVPDEEQLRALCPGLLSYFECEEKILRKDLTPYTRGIFYETKQFVNEICEDDSRLQKDYLASANCIRSLKDKYPICLKTAENIHSDFHQFVTGSDNGENMVKRDKVECLTMSYAVACIALEIQEACGTEAHDTYVEIVQRSFIKHVCNEHNIQTLRNDFLDFLSTGHENVEVYRRIFDFKKK